LPTSDVTAFARAALPDPPARVLEIGAGEGELAGVLEAAGYDVVAIDPAATGPPVRAVSLHELDERPASFDAALAVVSLHHVRPLDVSCRRLAELVRAGGTLAIDEFDLDRFDERAARWWLDHSGDSTEPGELIAGLREHLHPLARMRDALEPWFALGEPIRGPYLHRWNLPPGLREPEEQLIAAGGLPAVGARLVGVRRP
jgi:SAM-dependent methyltransferase